MPFTEDDYVPSDNEALYETLATALESVLDDPATNDGDILNALLVAQAALGQKQEQSLADLFNAAYISKADGEALELATQDIGITRRPPVAATGVVEMSHGGPTNATYTIASGTEVTTEGDDPIVFETTETAQIPLLDDFESGSLNSDWSGDTGSVTVQSTTTYNNSDYAVELPATSGVSITHSGNVTLRQGHTFYSYYYAQSNTQTGFDLFYNDSNNYYELLVDDVNDTISLDLLDAGTRSTEDSTNVTVPTGVWLEIKWETSVEGDHTVTVTNTSNDNTVVTLTTIDNTHVDGDARLSSQDANNTKYVDLVTTSACVANAQATEGGIATNLARDTLTSFVSSPTGVSSVTNPFPTGDPTITDTDDNPFITGRNEETDEELRERALDSNSIGGAATVDAIADAIRGVEGVESVTSFTNNTSNDNTNSGGLPEWSVELVVFGGDLADIGDAIHGSIAVTHNTYGGAHGTKETVTVPSSVLASDSRTYEISRPAEVNIDLTIDLFVTDAYVGDEVVKNTIVNYIGGIDTDNNGTDGRDVGEHVYVEELRSLIIDNVTGVLDIDSFSSTPSQTTDSNGIEIIEIKDGEIARTDATDGSLTINTTTV